MTHPTDELNRKGMMNIAMVGLMLASMTSFGQDKCSTMRVCDPRATMATEYLYAHFGSPNSALKVWIHDAYGDKDRIEMERRENRLERLAKWAETLAPENRRAYLAMIESYEDGEKKAYSEWHTHELQSSQAAYDEYLKRCAEAARKARETHPLPKPPTEIMK